MSIYSRSLAAACSGIGLLALGVFSLPEPVHAQFGLFIRVPGMGFHGCRYCGGRHSRHHDNDDSGNDVSVRDRDRNDSAPALDRPSTDVQNKILTRVASLNLSEVGTPLTEVGTTKDVNPVGKAVTASVDDRDWPKRVSDIAKRCESESRRVTTPGDVSEHAIEQSLEGAIKSAKLESFESFIGENWTDDHFRVKILDRVSVEIDSLFKGNTHGFASMQEVDKLIQRAAQSVYRRTFEVSELMAANRGSGLFMQRLYQLHSDLMDDQLRDEADTMLARVSNEAARKFEVALRQNSDGYALHYRAQRIVFDCLTNSLGTIANDVKTKGELEHNIEATGTGECVSWLDKQFGADGDKLSTQAPLPLRVVWSKDGAKDYRSMIGRTTN
ncbi:MAG: hypothetical protein ACLQJ0_03285 [Steroidobacteraceae bacterium]